MINSFFFIFACSFSLAAQELVSFCVAPPATTADVKQSLSFLLLPREKVFERPADRCLDVVTTSERVALLNKFLSKRYSLEDRAEGASGGDQNREECRLEFRTTKTKKVEGKRVKVGKKGALASTSETIKETSKALLLLGMGKEGFLEVTPHSLGVECRGKSANGLYQLVFSYQEKDRVRVDTEVSVKKNEPLNIAEIVNDLNKKSQTLGLPETSYSKTEGQETIHYELEIKD